MSNCGAQPVALGELKQTYKQQRSDLALTFKSDAKTSAFTHALSRNADKTLRALWTNDQWPSGTALLAVGGYGRAQLFPGSDVDILILLPGDLDAEPDEKTQALITTFVGQCWDLGMEIGHAVRTPEQCKQEAIADITVQTSLLEARWLAGSKKSATQLAEQLRVARDPQHFYQAKMLEMQQRHAKFQDTPYSLEPNIKESPGGLRDLQLVMWISRAAGMGQTWADLAKHELITTKEARVLGNLERFVQTLRARLHLVAGRREDRLVFDLQAPVARSFGITDESDRRASELLMQRYYRAAKQIIQANVLILQGLEARLFPSNTGTPEKLDEEFGIVRGMLDINDERLFEQNPSAILRAFILMAQHVELNGMTARTLQAMWRSRGLIDAKFRRDPVNRTLFMKLMQQERGITHELRRMNQWSILGRYLPAFRRIVGRMQHDLFHVYTVDQHILMVVRNLRRFAIVEHAHEYPLCSELIASFDKPWLLYLGALFHDIAKGRGGDHSKLGMVDARRFGRDHGLLPDQIELLEFLVEHHLTMSSVAQKQDLSDPDVIERFAQIVKSPYRLKAVYLLTVADIRGTSPKVWNGWKGKLLEELYRKTLRSLAGEFSTPDGELEVKQREAKVTLALYGLDEQAYKPLWDKLDISYFLRNDAPDIAWHSRSLFRQINTPKPVVRCRLSPHGEGFQVVVYTPDSTDLFARICGYFDSQSFSILDARVYTTLDQYALDSFVITAPDFADRYRDILQLVEHELAQCLTLAKPLGNPVRGRPSRRSRYFPVKPSVQLRPDERGTRYLLNVSATDRTGLLFSIAKVMAKHHVNLHMARIMTLGERVEDTFLVDGPTLANQREQLAFEEELLEALSVGV
jgi:[protein-PII] uridylyltransferase